MKIRSINDVITNSSDETFVIKTTKSQDEILKELEAELDRHEGLRDHFSGMGGVLETASRENYKDFGYSDCLLDLAWLPDNCVIVTIDYGWVGQLVEFLKKNYEIIPDFISSLFVPFLRAQADATLKSLEMMTKQEDIEKAYSEWEHLENLIKEYE